MRAQIAFLRTVALVSLAFLFTQVAMNQAAAGDSELLFKGRNLSEQEVERLEAKITNDEDNYESRVKLLGYHLGKRHRSPKSAIAHQEMVLWIIENHPTSEALGDGAAIIDHHDHKGAYEKAKTLWLKNVETHFENPQVFGSAAAFFKYSDRSKTEKYLQKAQNLDPKNYKWSIELAFFYRNEMLRLKGEQRKETAVKALAEFEKSYTLQPVGQQWYLLDKLARSAFEAGQYEKAEKFATQLLAAAKNNDGEWNTGNAIHHGNLVLGRIAIKENELEAARNHLIESAKIPGSPQLNSFGPNMTLAQELLERGEKGAVLKYFDLCGNFWSNDKLKTWKQQVTDGEMPDFGANLNY